MTERGESFRVAFYYGTLGFGVGLHLVAGINKALWTSIPLFSTLSSMSARFLIFWTIIGTLLAWFIGWRIRHLLTVDPDGKGRRLKERFQGISTVINGTIIFGLIYPISTASVAILQGKGASVESMFYGSIPLACFGLIILLICKSAVRSLRQNSH